MTEQPIEDPAGDQPGAEAPVNLDETLPMIGESRYSFQPAHKVFATAIALGAAAALIAAIAVVAAIGQATDFGETAFDRSGWAFTDDSSGSPTATGILMVLALLIGCAAAIALCTAVFRTIKGFDFLVYSRYRDQYAGRPHHPALIDGSVIDDDTFTTADTRRWTTELATSPSGRFARVTSAGHNVIVWWDGAAITLVEADL